VYFRELSRQVVRSLDPNAENVAPILQLVKYTIEKITKYRELAPQADDPNMLRTGKMCKTKKRSRYVGQGGVLDHKYANDGIKRFADAEEKKLEQQQALEEKGRLAEETKNCTKGPI